MEARLVIRNVVREKANRGEVEGNGEVGQERKEKWPHVELFCHSDCGRAIAGFDVDDIVEVGERRYVDRRHDLTRRELKPGQSVPTCTEHWKVLNKATYYLLQTHNVLP